MRDILGVFRVVREEKLDFFVFCFANLFFGAMALWVPPVVAATMVNADPMSEFGEVLRQGHGYFYALAILSASFPYWLREFIGDMPKTFFKLKLGTGMLSGAVIVICALFVPLVVLHGVTHQVPTEAATMRTWVLTAEVLCTVAALILTAYLFCLEHIDKYPQYGKALRDEAVKRIGEEMDGATTRSGLNLGG